MIVSTVRGQKKFKKIIAHNVWCFAKAGHLTTKFN
jgi:hypothetical protein